MKATIIYVTVSGPPHAARVDLEHEGRAVVWPMIVEQDTHGGGPYLTVGVRRDDDPPGPAGYQWHRPYVGWGAGDELRDALERYPEMAGDPACPFLEGHPCTIEDHP